MRDQFPGFYRPTKEQFEALWRDATIAVDANVLLNLYRYSAPTAKQLLDILRAVGDRLWVPHQAALEFHKNRLAVIQDRADMYGELLRDIGKAHSTLMTAAGRLKHHPELERDVIEKHATQMRDAIVAYVDGKRRASVDLLEDDVLDDAVLTELTELLTGKVGDALSADDLTQLYRAGRTRFERKQPPGYQDAPKPEPDRYGDLVVWEQLLRHGESTKRAIIFVTDDEKEDWWWKHRNHTVAPRQELIEEALARCGVGFYLYAPSRFMEEARNFLGPLVEVESGAIAEAQRTVRWERHLSNRSGSRTIILAFTPDEVCSMLGIDIWQLHRWVVAGLAGPSIASPEDGRVYSYADLCQLGVVKALSKPDTSDEVIRQAVEHLRNEAPRHWDSLWLVIRQGASPAVVDGDEEVINLLWANSAVAEIVDLEETQAEIDDAIERLDRPPTG